MEIPIQIPNGTNQVIIQVGDPHTIWLVVATLIIAGITLFGVLLSSKITRESNELLRTEIESKFRPIITRHVYQKKRHHPLQVNDDTCSITHEKIMFHVINNGMLPAIDVSYKYYIEPRDSPSTIMKLDPNDSSGSKKESSLAPSEYYSLDVPFETIGMYDIATSNVKCYFGMIIWYSDESKRRYYYHMEGFFNKSALTLNHVDVGTIN